STGAVWLDADWQGSIGGAMRDPWGAGAAETGGHGLGWRGELEVDGLVWLRNRVYDPASRVFLSPDPLPGVPGASSAANPYHYAANDPIGLLDPLGLRPLTDAELAAYRDAHSGTIASWLHDHSGEIATTGLVIAGTGLVLTGAGTAVGIGILAGVGSSAVIQHLTTGEVDWGQVAMSGFIGMVTGGTGAAVSNYSPVVSAGRQLASSGYPVIGGLTRYIGGGAAGGFTGGTLGEIADVAQGGNFDVATVAGETIAGGAFGALGGSVAVGQKLFTGVVTDEAHTFNTITGITGGFWTETAKARAAHGIKPPLPQPALPSP
ncbi:MAG: RHS repeat-associated core domain-containing protein, partial [Egibacteraceae bacterium]